MKGRAVAKQDRKAAKSSKNKRAGKRATAPTTPAGVPQVDVPEDSGAETTALARITQLEADRANLMAQVAWARGVAQEQQKALDAERQRAERLAADLEAQRTRIEALKALSLVDRLLGRHKRI